MRSDWLRARSEWSLCSRNAHGLITDYYIARSELPAVSREKSFPKMHIIDPLLTKLVRSRWVNVGFVSLLSVFGLRLSLGP